MGLPFHQNINFEKSHDLLIGKRIKVFQHIGLGGIGKISFSK